MTKSEEFLVKLIEKHLSMNHCLVQELRWGLLTKYEQNKRYQFDPFGNKMIMFSEDMSIGSI